MPQISVIVPVYKVEPYLHRCIDSILAQTFTDFELILVDDGSPDNCGKICDEYAEKDSRVKVIHQENGGLSAARNAGLDWVFANSDSEWIAFVDSDDYVAENYLELLYEAAKVNNADLSMCGFTRVYENGEIKDDKSFENEVLNRTEAFNLIIEKWYAVVAWNKLYKKEIFSKIRYPKNRIHEDEYVIHHILYNCNIISLISDKLYYYLQRDTSIMSTKKVVNYLDTLEAFIDRYYFCKELKLPFNTDCLYSLYSQVCNCKSGVAEKEKRRLRKLKKEYKNIFFSIPGNNTFKRKLWFYFNKTYTYLYSLKSILTKRNIKWN